MEELGSEVWRFETANLVVIMTAADEDLDPADSFQFEEDIEEVRSGAVEWFCAKVAVYLKDDGIELGADSLGGCAYRTVREFYVSHRDCDPMNRNCSIMRQARGQNVVICHYFPEMVAIACSEARSELRKIQAIRVRAESVT